MKASEKPLNRLLVKMPEGPNLEAVIDEILELDRRCHHDLELLRGDPWATHKRAEKLIVDLLGDLGLDRAAVSYREAARRLRWSSWPRSE